MSIRIKLVIMFLAIALIPLLFVSILTFRNYKNSLEANRLSQLQNVAVFKAERIETYFAELKANIEIAQGFYNIKKTLPVLARLTHDPNNPEFLAAQKMLGEQLPQMQSVSGSGLSDIMLVNPEGRVVYANRPGHYSKDLSKGYEVEQKAFSQGKEKIYFSDVYFDSEDNRLEILVTAPASDFNGAFIGVIAFEVDMTPVHKLIQDVIGLGKTGEVLVGKKVGNEVVYLNPLRYEPDTVMKRINIGEEAGGPIQEAVQGRSGAGQLIDYRGKKVIAAWRYIPSLGWGMVAKIDTKEAFADVTNLRNLVAIILVVIIVLSGVMAFSIAQSISEPIKRLSEGAEIIGSGNLDYKIGTNLKDEIGQLSRSFDKMTLDLKRTLASRDELSIEVRERKQAEEELARSNRDLEQFAYVASHDLQEPLRAVAGFVGLLRMQLRDSLDAKKLEYMNFATDGVARMQALISGLLEYSRVGTGGKKPEMTDSKAALGRAIAYLGGGIREFGAKITADDLPKVCVDATQLTQLFQNLIGNAIKFCSEQTPQVHISAIREDNAWRFAVADNGIGIEPQYAERIFQIFQRLHSRDKYPGTGIGLSICKKIVERHGGKIWVESKPGSGSTFYFTIPDKGDI